MISVEYSPPRQTDRCRHELKLPKSGSWIKHANVGAPGVADQLGSLLTTSIRLKTERLPEGNLGVGSSRLGGTPDFAPGSSWPEFNGVPMAFLGSDSAVGCCGLGSRRPPASFGTALLLQKTKEQTWGFDPKDRGNWIVICYNGDLGILQPASPPANLPEESRFQCCRVTFSMEIAVPPYDSKSVERLRLSDTEGDAYVNLLGALDRGEPIHRLLGYPEPIQGDMQQECQFVSNGVYTGGGISLSEARRTTLEKGIPDWQLLLQIDSDDSLQTMWGDAGRIYFSLREQDLKNQDFGKVWLSIQCY